METQDSHETKNITAWYLLFDDVSDDDGLCICGCYRCKPWLLERFCQRMALFMGYCFPNWFRSVVFAITAIQAYCGFNSPLVLGIN